MTLLYEQPTAEPLTPEQQFEHDIALVLQTALEHHHKGEFDDAEALYKAILEASPATPTCITTSACCTCNQSSVEALPHFEAALGRAAQRPISGLPISTH